jgi:hypothetical protein
MRLTWRDESKGSEKCRRVCGSNCMLTQYAKRKQGPLCFPGPSVLNGESAQGLRVVATYPKVGL